MCRLASAVAALCLCLLARVQAPAGTTDQAQSENDPNGVRIAVTNCDVRDEALELRYEIANASQQDVWILAGLGRTGVDAETFMDEDGCTLLIHRRFDVPTDILVDHLFHARYIRLRPGMTRAESIVLALPVYGEWPLSKVREGQGPEEARAVAVVIGYYEGDLPEMIRAVLKRADSISGGGGTVDEKAIKGYFRGSLHFNMVSEKLRDRNEEVLVPYTSQWFKGELALRSAPANACVMYDGTYDPDRRAISLDVPSCTRIEVDYHPSMLDFFFPYASEQSLLDPQERERLESRETTVAEDSESAQAFVDNINTGVPTPGRVPRVTWADVVCYAGTERVASFPVCNDDSVVKDARDRFAYPDGVLALRRLPPEVRPLELRVRCGRNLKNLWYRLRLFPKADPSAEDTSSNGITYPDAALWCDAIVSLFEETTVDPSLLISMADVMGPYRCPSAGEGKCHYAMNPNCKVDSPGDTVLLFETKAGWNQHGGPEEFTFDNHDPQGGCVLLNDGTVKFIRTEEELKQLRWKP